MLPPFALGVAGLLVLRPRPRAARSKAEVSGSSFAASGNEVWFTPLGTGGTREPVRAQGGSLDPAAGVALANALDVRIGSY